MINKPKILIYQNEDTSLLIEYLQANDFAVVSKTFPGIEDALAEKDFDLCILDYYLNASDRLKLLRLATAAEDNKPIIFLSREATYENIVTALTEGADDFIALPCNFAEVIARIQALLRRSGIQIRSIEKVYNIGNTVFDTQTNLLVVNTLKVKLTKKEARIMTILCAHKNEVVSRSLIVKYGWQKDNYFNRQVLHVYMTKLREYLQADTSLDIKTIYGEGYSLCVRA